MFSVQDFKVYGLGLGFRVQRAGLRAQCLISVKSWVLGFELSGFVFRCSWLMLRVNMQLGFLFSGLRFRVSCFKPRNPDPYTRNRISGTDLSRHDSAKASMAEELEFRVSCFVSRVSCFVFRVWCFMFCVLCFVSHVLCFVFRVSYFMFRVSCLMVCVSCFGVWGRTSRGTTRRKRPWLQPSPPPP